MRLRRCLPSDRPWRRRQPTPRTTPPPLTASAEGGLPEGHFEDTLLAAEGTATPVSEGAPHVVMLEATGLVAAGLYTVWWDNPGIMGMSMGPGGGVPGNEFRADANGNAETILRVPADNDCELMVIAYPADDRIHCTEPGAMGGGDL